ncbi:hypothetical protein BJ508DRAFT_166182 [Ascobolus immersus RN42]|uniref:Uncharacterized protein n=1 Tax=Ascobolus immersus RN42 TaxID=1160509 RepID=A0A3N4IHN2_ASCIM|nr:hypothetical protein BJ508DRAFT_166182 [Ascobolus immersus RN42]
MFQQRYHAMPNRSKMQDLPSPFEYDDQQEDFLAWAEEEIRRLPHWTPYHNLISTQVFLCVMLPRIPQRYREEGINEAHLRWAWKVKGGGIKASLRKVQVQKKAVLQIPEKYIAHMPEDWEGWSLMLNLEPRAQQSTSYSIAELKSRLIKPAEVPATIVGKKAEKNSSLLSSKVRKEGPCRFTGQAPNDKIHRWNPHVASFSTPSSASVSPTQFPALPVANPGLDSSSSSIVGSPNQVPASIIFNGAASTADPEWIHSLPELPLPIQTQLFAHLQQALEHSLFCFISANFPSRMDPRWTCPEALELNRAAYFLRYNVATGTTRGSQDIQEIDRIFKCLKELRHSAVHRHSLSVSRILRIIQSSILLSWKYVNDPALTEELVSFENIFHWNIGAYKNAAATAVPASMIPRAISPESDDGGISTSDRNMQIPGSPSSVSSSVSSNMSVDGLCLSLEQHSDFFIRNLCDNLQHHLNRLQVEKLFMRMQQMQQPMGPRGFIPYGPTGMAY